MRAWLQRRWERRVGHVFVGEWLRDLGAPTPLAIRIKKLHDKQHPTGWKSCEVCVGYWNAKYGNISPVRDPSYPSGGSNDENG